MNLGERASQFAFLIRDRDGKFSRMFDEVFTSNAIRVITTPPHSPRAGSPVPQPTTPLHDPGRPIDLTAKIERRHAVGGIIHEYRRVA
jgi:hypothetical protein